MDDNPLARFIADKRHLRGPQLWRAFTPDGTHNETSVFDVDGLRELEVWDLGDRYVAPTRGEVIARAQIQYSDPLRLSLEVVFAEPPLRHRAIRGWPLPSAKEVRNSLAQQLAERAVLVMRTRVMPLSDQRLRINQRRDE